MSAKPDHVLEFLKGYADILRNFELPESDFPLYCRTEMARGRCIVYTADDRHVASIRVDGGGQSPSMPITGPDIAYSQLFVELINGYMAFLKERTDGT